VEPGQVETEESTSQAASSPTAGAVPAAAEITNVVQVRYALLDGMTAGAAARFQEEVRQFAASLARETSRLEEAQRVEDEETVEITTTMVANAAGAIRRHKSSESTPLSQVPQTSNPTFMWTIFATISGIVAGIFGSYLHSAWQWVGCIIFGVLTMIFLVLAYYKVVRRQ
jgi:hypothetical protein